MIRTIFFVQEDHGGIPQDPLFASLDELEARERLKNLRITHMLEEGALSNIRDDVSAELIAGVLLQCSNELVDELYRASMSAGDPDDYIYLFAAQFNDKDYEVTNRELTIAEETSEERQLLPNFGHLIAHYIDLNSIREKIGVERFLLLIENLARSTSYGDVNTCFNEAGLESPFHGNDTLVPNPELRDR